MRHRRSRHHRSTRRPHRRHSVARSHLSKRRSRRNFRSGTRTHHRNHISLSRGGIVL
jgi:hypothetical protein